MNLGQCLEKRDRNARILRYCNTEQYIIEAIQTLDRATIKGPGPAAANLLYFLDPTLAPPFNTAIVRGYTTP